ASLIVVYFGPYTLETASSAEMREDADMIKKTWRIGYGTFILAALIRCQTSSGYSDATNPLAPAGDQVQARFAVIQQEITRLQQIGDIATATAYSTSLQHFTNELAGIAPSDVPSP